MIRRLVLSLEGIKEPVPRNLAYLLYSALCDLLPVELADAMHEQGATPLSAYIMRSGNDLLWVLSGFGSAGYVAIDILQELSELKLNKLNTVLQLKIVANPAELTEDIFMHRHLVENMPKNEYVLQFVTPTSFKSGGEYVFMPSKNLILKSLIQRWDAEAQKFKLTDNEAIQDIIEHCRITRYKLSSCSYPLKGINIPAFEGSITLSARGPDPLLRIVALLMDFANYSGVGIKTALGMGGVIVL